MRGGFIKSYVCMLGLGEYVGGRGDGPVVGHITWWATYDGPAVGAIYARLHGWNSVLGQGCVEGFPWKFPLEASALTTYMMVVAKMAMEGGVGGVDGPILSQPRHAGVQAAAQQRLRFVGCLVPGFAERLDALEQLLLLDAAGEIDTVHKH